MTRGLTVVELFCGAGGLSLGLQQAGFKPVYAIDNDPDSCATYSANFPLTATQLDLSTAKVETIVRDVLARTRAVDLVCGGPPCQGFSMQGRGHSEDDRNALFLKFVRIAIGLKPKAILVENVPTILGPRGRPHVPKALDLLRNSGYKVETHVVQAADFRVPQIRKRAIIVALRAPFIATFKFPRPALQPSQYRTVRQAIGDLPQPLDNYAEHPRYKNHVRRRISEINLERIQHVPEGGGRLDVPRRLQLPCHMKANGHRHLDVFGRLRWDMPAATITAMFDNFTRGRFAHPDQHRNITNREGARLQSFPDSFHFVGPQKSVARQIGNAVPPLLARAIGSAIRDAVLS
jgi:DNA (cytosine-5)-methyltransferase 1